MSRRYLRGGKASKRVLLLDDIGTFNQLYRRNNAVINVAKTLKRSAQDIEDELNVLFIGKMIRELTAYPPRKLGMPMRWKSAKQRRYVMMLLRKQADARGDDEIWYHRTGKYKKSWKAETEVVTTKKGVIRVRVYNDAKKVWKGQQVPLSQFIQGRIGFGTSRRSITRYRDPIQPFHTDRGWVVAYPVIQKYYAKMREHALASWGGKIEEMRAQL